MGIDRVSPLHRCLGITSLFSIILWVQSFVVALLWGAMQLGLVLRAFLVEDAITQINGFGIGGVDSIIVDGGGGTSGCM